MKIKGDELKAFLDEAWPGEDWYWDYDLFEEPDPFETYDTADIGGVYYQGRGEDPTNGSGYSLATLIKKWRMSRDYDVLTIKVPKARTEEIREALKSLGIAV